MKKETLLLAYKYKNEDIGGGYVSEKLDGMRCLWLPFTRGMKKKDVPFANTDKDGRLVKEEICTGLWSRYMNVIHAPDIWLDQLPNVVLDGELYSDSTPRQDLMSIVKKKNERVEPDRWVSHVMFHTFALPYYGALFADGVITGSNYSKMYDSFDNWVEPYIACLDYHPKSALTMRQEVTLLEKHVSGSLVTVIVPQEKLPMSPSKALAIVMERLGEITDRGGEGAMVRRQFHVYKPHRSHDLLKFKKLDDAEGTVVGYTTGKITDKESRHRGRMGALTLRLANGRTFDLSGFTDAEREFGSQEARQWAYEHPDCVLPTKFQHTQFPHGMEVTFRYRGLTSDDIPTEARYWRKR